MIKSNATRVHASLKSCTDELTVWLNKLYEHRCKVISVNIVTSSKGFTGVVFYEKGISNFNLR